MKYSIISNINSAHSGALKNPGNRKPNPGSHSLVAPVDFLVECFGTISSADAINNLLVWECMLYVYNIYTAAAYLITL